MGPTRRSHGDNESLPQAAIREVKEETGLDIEITGLVGTYTDPRHIIAYTDGEVRRQSNICFRARITPAANSRSPKSPRSFASSPVMSLQHSPSIKHSESASPTS